MSEIICGISTNFFNKENRAPLKPSRNKDTGKYDGSPSNRWALSAFYTKRQTVEQLVKHILSGGAFAVSYFEKNRRNGSFFIAAYIVGLDFDANVSVETLKADSFIRQHAFLIYPSPSSTTDKPKSRVLFRLDEPVTWDAKRPETRKHAIDRYSEMVKALMKRYQHLKPDENCKDAPRLFFGSTNRVEQPYTNYQAVLPVCVLGSLTHQLAIDENERRDAPKAATYVPTGDEAEQKGARSYNNLLDIIRGASDERHKVLLSVGKSMFARVAGGWPTFNTSAVERDLYAACIQNGYVSKVGEHEVKRVIDCARRYGQEAPKAFEFTVRTEPSQGQIVTTNGHTPATDTQPVKLTEAEGLAALASAIRESSKARNTGDVNTDPVTLIKKADEELSALKKHYLKPSTVTFESAADKAIAELEEAFANPSRVRGLRTDMGDVDELIGGWRPDWLVVVYGATGMGKSTFCTSVLREWINNPGLIVPTEMSSTPYLRKIVAACMGITSDKIEDGYLTKTEYKQAMHLLTALKKLTSKFLEGGSPTPASIELAVKDAVETRGAKWVVVDSVSKMMSPGVADTRTNISYAMDILQGLAIEHHIPILVTSQVGRKVSERGNKRPQLDDAAESAQVERNADVILTIYNHSYYTKRGMAELDPAFPENTSLLTLEKHRHRDAGGLGVMLKFVGGSGFYPIARVDEQNEIPF